MPIAAQAPRERKTLSVLSVKYISYLVFTPRSPSVLEAERQGTSDADRVVVHSSHLQLY